MIEDSGQRQNKLKGLKKEVDTTLEGCCDLCAALAAESGRAEGRLLLLLPGGGRSAAETRYLPLLEGGRGGGEGLGGRRGGGGGRLGMMPAPCWMVEHL